eukprot:TRINITY_DN29003_c0_g1_i1.p1 TRINITY_DN29003_c0_g1~~TRINITY_DN29003_c0_g1_i1.p1  ORF type:complete len:215 (+),score=38.44 TRINITY_DN29003_c0_g1_i1:22-666(+)
MLIQNIRIIFNLLISHILNLIDRFHKRPEIIIEDKYTTTGIVLPCDVDAAFHVNNAQFLSLFELSRFSWLSRLYDGKLLSSVWKLSLWPVIGNIIVLYHNELPLFSRYTVECQMLTYDEFGSFYEQRILVGNKLIAVAILRIVFLGKGGESKRKRRIPLPELSELAMFRCPERRNVETIPQYAQQALAMFKTMKEQCTSTEKNITNINNSSKMD